MTSVVVAGALASKAGSGGEAWVRLSYALGFRRLGCDVRLVEEAPAASIEALEYARSAAGRFGLGYGGADEVEGGDLLVNVSGNVRSEEIRRRFGRTAFVDIDPGFTQFWHEQGVEAIPEHLIWSKPNEQSNSVGNLLLHLEGNVRQWIISGVKGDPDVRHRAGEFAATEGATSPSGWVSASSAA